MAKSQQTFNKSEKEKKRLKKALEKKKKKEEKKLNPSSGGFDSMIVYVDANGNFTDTPPDLSQREEIDVSTIEIGVPKREDEEVITERKGSVEFYNDSKGFGFIKEHQSNEKYFFHVNGLIDEVVEGNKVSFELEQGLKGLNAVKVTKI